MKILKKIGFVILTIVIIFFVVALFVDRDFRVSRSIEIQQPRAAVFEYVRYLRNHNDFAVWNSMDPDMAVEYEGEDGKVGFVYKWDSTIEDVGAGEQEIVEISPYDQIKYEIRFKRPWETTNYACFDFEGNDGSTTVTWSIAGSTPYPFNFFNLFLEFDEMIGKDLQDGLNNLKVNLEKNRI